MKSVTILISTLASLMFLASHSYGQDISSGNINWISSLTTVANPLQLTSEVTQFITYSSDSIHWLAADGKLKYSLVIKETNGTWTDVNQPGTIIFEADNKGSRAVVKIQRGSDLKVRMMLATDADPIVYELTIDSFTTF